MYIIIISLNLIPNSTQPNFILKPFLFNFFLKKSFMGVKSSRPACECYEKNARKCHYKEICQAKICGKCGKQRDGLQHQHISSCCKIVLDPINNADHRYRVHDCKCSKCDSGEEVRFKFAGIQFKNETKRLCSLCNTIACPVCKQSGELNMPHLCLCKHCLKHGIQAKYGTINDEPCNNCKYVCFCKFCGKSGIKSKEISDYHECICQGCRQPVEQVYFNKNILPPFCIDCQVAKNNVKVKVKVKDTLTPRRSHRLTKSGSGSGSFSSSSSNAGRNFNTEPVDTIFMPSACSSFPGKSPFAI